MHEFRAALCGRSRADNRVARANRGAGPAIVPEKIRAIDLDGPLLDYAFVVLHVGVHKRVRIGPLHFRDHAGNGDQVGHIEHGAGMMRPRRSGEKKQEARDQDDSTRSHCAIPHHAIL